MTNRLLSLKVNAPRAAVFAMLSSGALLFACSDDGDSVGSPIIPSPSVQGSVPGAPIVPGSVTPGVTSGGPVGSTPGVPPADTPGVVPGPVEGPVEGQTPVGTSGEMCSGTTVTTQKRLVRLTDNQLVNTYTTLFGEAAADMFTGEEILPAEQRAFPPLATIGTSLGQSAFDLRDRVAGRAMDFVGANLGSLTPCGDEPTDDACGLDAVLEFAREAYRRDLTAEETQSYQTLWTQLTVDNGGSVAEAIRYGYDAVLLSPGFLYRTETGGDWATSGPLDSYELASEISYFLTDGPPDEALLADAATGALTGDTIRSHASRLLETEQARANLESALIGYFQLTTVPNIVLDEEAVPGFEVTSGLKNSMYREAQEFIKNILWGGALGELITSRRSWINSQLAPIYGVEVNSRDVDTFTEVMLPEGRSGLLTLSPFLTSKSRPNGTSVVGRGLAVNAALVCSQNPPFPEGNTALAEVIASQEGWTEKQKADFRADPANVACAGCHAQFDAMGLVLEAFDAIGRPRTEDAEGNVIDAAWTTSALPPAFSYDQDGDSVPDVAVVSSPAQLAEALLRTEPDWGTNALTRCMAMNFINYALADESQGSARSTAGDHPTNSCAVRAVTDAFEATPDQSFSSLVAEIAASETLSIRSAGM